MGYNGINYIKQYLLNVSYSFVAGDRLKYTKTHSKHNAKQ